MSLTLKSYTLPQLKQLRARIAKEISKQESAGKVSFLKRLKRMASEHGLSLDDVLGNAAQGKRQKPVTAKPAPTQKAPLPVKYRHPSNKELTWSGRGRKPQWVEAWLANGGALDALATAAEKFAKKQQRKAASSESAPTGAKAVAEAASVADAAATAA